MNDPAREVLALVVGTLAFVGFCTLVYLLGRAVAELWKQAIKRVAGVRMQAYETKLESAEQEAQKLRDRIKELELKERDLTTELKKQETYRKKAVLS